MIEECRRLIEPLLPEGCPFVVGGGLVRDGILGGRPSDIDIWLPSNISIPGIDSFLDNLQRRTYGWETNVMFTGPGAYAPEGGTIEGAEGNYGDVNNHWVIEASISPTTPTLNFMRSMTPWTGNPQEFFNGLMRAFDIDYCMFFIGYMPGEHTANTVIMPQHMANNVAAGRTLPSQSGRFSLNSIYWNKYRLDNTSQARIDARLQKMRDKYNFWNIRSGLDTVGFIEVDQIIATPMLLSTVMRRVNSMSGDVVIPTNANATQRGLTPAQFLTILNNRRA